MENINGANPEKIQKFGTLKSLEPIKDSVGLIVTFGKLVALQPLHQFFGRTSCLVYAPLLKLV